MKVIQEEEYLINHAKLYFAAKLKNLYYFIASTIITAFN